MKTARKVILILLTLYFLLFTFFLIRSTTTHRIYSHLFHLLSLLLLLAGP
jgi:hypothetical protein